MTTAATSLLGLALPVTGELQGTWGTTVNDSITSLLDTAVAGTTTLSTDGDVTLSTTTLAANQARQAIILWTANGTTTRNITAPAQSKIYTVINASAGTQSIVLRGAGPTTGVTIIKGESAVCAWNGSDFIKISNTGGSASFTNVTVSGTTTLSGLTASTALALNSSKEVVSVTNTGTGNNVLSASPTLTGTISAAALTLSSDLTLSGGTANGVLYLNGSKVATSGSALTFDGTTLTGTSATTAANLILNNTGASTQTYATLNSGATILGALLRPNTTNDIQLNANYGSLVWGIGSAGTASEAMRLTSTGLGIGTSSPSYKLDVFTGVAGVLQRWNTGSVSMLVEADHSGNGNWYLSPQGSQTFNVKTGGSTRLTLDSSGNLGLGVTPSAWGGVYRALQVGSTAVFGGNTAANRNYSSSNVYWNGSSYRYITTSQATQFEQSDGAYYWLQAASGTAGDAITFIQAMTLDASGNWLLGTTSAYGKVSAALTSPGSLGSVVNVASFGSSAVFSLGGVQNNNDGVYLGTGDAVSGGKVASGIGFLREGSGWNSALAFYTNNVTSGPNGVSAITERARIDSSGNFGIGTSSPSGIFNIKTSNGQLLVQNGTSSAQMRISAFNNAGNANAALIFEGYTSEYGRFDSSGNLGLGVTPSAWRSTEKAFQIGSGSFHSYQSAGINVSSNAYINSSNQDVYVVNGYANRYLQAVGTGAHYWYIAPSGTAGNAISFTQAMTLDSSGNLLVGTTTAISSARLTLGGALGGGTSAEINNSDATSWIPIRFHTASTLVGYISSNTTTTSYNTSSDYRLKNTIAPMTGALAKVAALKPVTYKWNADGSDGEGFIAHELAEVVPQCVTGEKDAVDAEGNPQYQGIDTSFLVATLTAAIQELKAEFDAYKASHP